VIRAYVFLAALVLAVELGAAPAPKKAADVLAGELDLTGPRLEPGDALVWNLDPDRQPAENVLHWFRPDAPGQLRGVTPLAPALDIFAQLRRITRSSG
jgi:hypothetical protein